LSQQCRRCNEWCGCLCFLAMQPDARHVCSAFVESQSPGLTAKDMTFAVATVMQPCQLARAAATMLGDTYVCGIDAQLFDTTLRAAASTILNCPTELTACVQLQPGHTTCDAVFVRLHLMRFRGNCMSQSVTHFIMRMSSKLTACPCHRTGTTLLQLPLYQFTSDPCSCPIALSTSLLFLCLVPKERHGP
jgi:hypothetical protein